MENENNTDQERLYAAALISMPHIGNKTLRALVETYGSAAAVWQAPCQEWCCAAPLAAHVPELERWRKQYDWDTAVHLLERHQAQLVTLWEAAYPESLRQTFNPPVVLFYKGALTGLAKAVAVVGSRKATAYGLNAAQSLSGDMARNGITVVSGGARGIDTRAHEGALLAQGKTIAVVANGLDHTYPRENRQLFDHIVCQGGAIISEFPFGVAPLPQHFPARNRIIAGLARGVVVIEAASKSGSLITADFALEEGRDVFAVPGSIYSPLSKGTNELLRKGAIALTGIQDILDEYDWRRRRKKTAAPLLSLTLEESAVLAVISKDAAVSVEEVIVRTGLAASSVGTALLQLQLKDLIRDMGSCMYIQRG
ncbi:MAG: DNA-processing protein DprA [Megasphaera sp.]|nr:DNA-processing protein DprA [Megasphaera sp.]MCH4217098.1 DNA-processing protein DprA [Megasphaera sp.]